MNQFFNGMPFNFSNIPSTKELWKEEKSKYRNWIILLIILLVIIIGLYITMIAVGFITYEKIAEEAFINNNDKSLLEQDFIYNYRLKLVIQPIIILGIIVLGFSWYIQSIFISYKEKSFSHISSIATLIIGISAFYSGFDLLQMLWNPSYAKNVINYTAGVLGVVTNIVFILGYFGISSKVSKIRSIFIRSKLFEINKNNLKEMEEKIKEQNSKGSFLNTNKNDLNKNDLNKNELEEHKNEEKLSSMSLSDLKIVAKKLSISGYETMKKTEIIEAIIKVSKK